MIYRGPELEPELASFLKGRAVERYAPRDVRARALARARAILASDGVIWPARLPELPPALPPAGGGSRVLLRAALMASVVIASGAVGAFAALHGRAAQGPQTFGTVSPVTAASVVGRSGRERAVESPSLVTPRVPAAKLRRPSRAASDTDLFAAEIALLQRAEAAYTRRDFSRTLTLIAEHARRFPRGHLAEEREALRVQSLVGEERSDEAHRAAAAFAVRFPRSVLLPRVSRGLDLRRAAGEVEPSSSSVLPNPLEP